VNDLTATELKVLNNVTDVRSLAVDLGTKIQTVIDSLVKSMNSPSNAVNAWALLTLDGVVKDSQKVLIGVDTYEFLADAEQTKTFPGHIAVDIETDTVKAVGELTVDTKPTSGDKMTIGTKVYTFVPVGTDTADGEISIGADLAGAQANILAAINGTDEFNIAHSLVSCSTWGQADSCVITALVGGTPGNTIATTEVFTAETNVFDGVHLVDGADCEPESAVTALLLAISTSGTELVDAIMGEGAVTIEVTAVTAGEAGNLISLNETLTNGSWGEGVTEMAEGLDGTVGVSGALMVDEDYLYITLAPNTVSGKNWVRVAVESFVGSGGEN